MKKRWTLWQKLKAVTALIVVFLLVLATNLMDKKHLEMVENSLTSVYKDRLLAKDYLYKISRQLQQKRNVLRQQDLNQIERTIEAADDSLQTLMNLYEQTKMTGDEHQRLLELKHIEDNLIRKENLLFNTKDQVEMEAVKEEVILTHEDMILKIDQLFAIQMKEGKRQIDNSNRAIDRSNFIAQLEIGALIVIGLILQFLIFFKPASDD
ncbi:MCP four helix bundle domain-containing protein [Marinoscillum sp.]|uniref:MCP four helix bundle domain-containing protein n=1 Tax=Marinoscillum sp. TaxID=2024838 RepID=UPI003BA88769